MSERTTTSGDVNPNPTPEQAPAEEAAARREGELRAEAKATLDASAKAYARGESALRAGMLEAGRLAGEYLQQRLALGDKRVDAVGLVAMRWSEHSATLLTATDVEAAIRASRAHQLLAVEQGLVGEGRKQGSADVVPYGQWLGHWSRLVECEGRGTPDEVYVLLPGLEGRCREFFAKAVKEALGRTAVAEGVSEIVRSRSHDLAQRDALRAEEAKAKAKAEAEGAAKAAAELKASQEAQRVAEEAAKAKGDEATAQALSESTADLVAKQKAMLEAQSRAEQAERQRKTAEKAAAAKAAAERKAAEKAQRKAAEKAAAEAEDEDEDEDEDPKVGSTRKEEGRAPLGEPAGGNLLRAAGQAGTVKDVAGMAVELLVGTGQPDDVLAELLRQLKAGGHVSKRGVSAIDAALLVLSRKADGATPVNRVASALNGKPAAAVA